MLASKNKLIDIVCYTIIFILSLLIILPPLLRFLAPKDDKTSTATYYETLRCTKQEQDKEKIINTQYKNKEISKVFITYTNYTDSDEIVEKSLIGINGVSEDVENNTTVYTIEYNDETKSNGITQNYFGKIDDLKSNYEMNNFTCVISTS